MINLTAESVTIASIDQRQPFMIGVSSFLSNRHEKRDSLDLAERTMNYSAILRDKLNTSIGAFQDNQLAGYYIVRSDQENVENLHLTEFVVDDDFRKRGIGHLLVEHLVKEAKRKKQTNIFFPEQDLLSFFSKALLDLKSPKSSAKVSSELNLKLIK